MSFKLVTFTGMDGQVYAGIRGGNGEPVFSSEGHPDKRDAEAAIMNLVRAIQEGDYEVDFEGMHEKKPVTMKDEYSSDPSF